MQMESNCLYRQTWAEVDLAAIRHNVSSFRHWLPESKQLMAVVKANGYGHGALPVAQAAQQAGATWLAVALLEEALELREAGVTLPILVFGHIQPEAFPLAQEHGISVSINHFEDWFGAVKHVDPSLAPLRFHLKIDTGMSRLGLLGVEELERMIISYKEKGSSQLVWEGLYTHLATADEEDSTYLQQQLQRFQQARDMVQRAGIPVSYVHAENSAATIRFRQHLDTNLVRIGISMYGLYPSPWMKELLPFHLKEAFSLYSRLSMVKRINEGVGVSYGAAYRAKQGEWVGTIPIGYADGWRRALSNRAEVIINGQRHRLIGRVCMDQCMVRLVERQEVGEKVTLIGGQGPEAIRIDDIAAKLGTINYEVPCMISARVPRLYRP